MLDDLIRLVPPPMRPRPRSVDWVAVEQRLGHSLPDDYKALVVAYGPGRFAQFIHIYQPHNATEAVDLESQINSARWALEYLRQTGESIPYATNENTGLVAIGRTDNGDVLYLVRRPIDDPNGWIVTVNEARGDTWDEFDGGITSFLTEVLSGRRRVVVFPDGFAGERPRFEPYDP
jgi:hypothetical protein